MGRPTTGTRDVERLKVVETLYKHSFLVVFQIQTHNSRCISYAGGCAAVFAKTSAKLTSRAPVWRFTYVFSDCEGRW